MKTADVLIVGGGPAGLSAAIKAAENGASVVLADRQAMLGGQLVKQTHKFFGSKEQRAGHRGIEIAAELSARLQSFPHVTVMTETEVLGYYSDGVVTLDQTDKWIKIKPSALVIAAGASEKPLVFPNNDLPGIYGAGAVQTLMNVYGVMPGKRALMVGAGNIGLIVSYQLAQAGVDVAAVIEASPQIGGYAVHASKIRRMGIPILTSHIVKSAHGTDSLEKAVVWEIDERWQGIPGTEVSFDADILCLAVGLSPTTDILWHTGCEMVYVPELGGHVPRVNEEQQTTVPSVFVAGDAAGVEEASSAMMTGTIAGLSAVKYLGRGKGIEEQIKGARQSLDELRSGPTGEKIRTGLARMAQMGGGPAC